MYYTKRCYLTGRFFRPLYGRYERAANDLVTGHYIMAYRLCVVTSNNLVWC